MIRRVFTPAAWLSLLLCLGIIVLWVRSYRATDWLMWKPDDWPSDSVRTITLRSIRGGVQIEDYRLSWTGDHRYMKEIPGWFWGIGEPARDIRWTRGYSQLTYDPSVHSSPYDWPDFTGPRLIPPLFSYRDRVADGTYTNTWRGWVVPLWLPAAAAGILPALAGARRIAARRRIIRGRCRTCGYDLRATPDRCPECGRPVTQKVTA